jgi:hypothetical protein
MGEQSLADKSTESRLAQKMLETGIGIIHKIKKITEKWR